ncbi:MAG: hypothetical protein NZ908_02590 [Candidatus Micrarchaeota archaeon]|nr:hypothetical protein [Candidatus Micrarchaeota archaeon]MCX8154573.1 hypothetical protein [Candidatus Micrarchaeota archaeon]
MKLAGYSEWYRNLESLITQINHTDREKIIKVLSNLEDIHTDLDFIDPKTLVGIIRDINDVRKSTVYLRFSMLMKYLDRQIQELIKIDPVVLEIISTYLDVYEKTREKPAPNYTIIVDVPIDAFARAVKNYRNNSLDLFLYIHRKFHDLDPYILTRILYYTMKYTVDLKNFFDNLYNTPPKLQKYMIRKIILWKDDPRTYSRKIEMLDDLFSLNNIDPNRFYDVVLKGEIDSRVRSFLDEKDRYLITLKNTLQKHFNQDQIPESLLNLLEATKKYVLIDSYKYPITYKIDIVELDRKLELLKRHGNLTVNILRDREFVFDSTRSFETKLRKTLRYF